MIVLLYGLIVNPLLYKLGSWAGYKNGSWLMSATRSVAIAAIWHWLYKPFASRPELIIQLLIVFWFDLLLSRLIPPPPPSA
jgi:hypothetical protein